MAGTPPKDRDPNRLLNSTSPYLLQHAYNPVDWYEWGEEAIQRARDEDKPIFLSVGYAACHWCHVMERESFEDPTTAKVMNDLYVNIKVDREERPDIDSIYMTAVQSLTGSGGWPMSVWLTPELKPFYGGTYFPPYDMYGRAGFRSVLQGLHRAYREDRDKVTQNAEGLTQRIQDVAGMAKAGEALPANVFDQAIEQTRHGFDAIDGGFTSAPKFPHSLRIGLLLREEQKRGDDGKKPTLRHMLEFTLERMAHGGIYDQIGGGFHRYSVDEEWLVPHFEKMLYDNALLVDAYLEAWQATKNPLYQRVVNETLQWVLRDMKDKDGGIYSTLDADSEGVEGKFYVWDTEEVDEVLDEHVAALFKEYYDIKPGGNFEGHSIPNIPKDGVTLERLAERENMHVDDLRAQFTDAKWKLRALREKRVWPGLDDKILTAWNGMILASFSRAARVLDSDEYKEAALGIANFVLTNLRRDDGRLLASYREGKAHLNGYVDDYAYLISGLIELYQTDFNPKWLREAKALQDLQLTHFWDEEHGGFFFVADDHEQLIARMKEGHDGATPSGNGISAINLVKLASYFHDETYREKAEATIRSFSEQIKHYPPQFCSMLQAHDLLQRGTLELVIADGDGTPADEMVKAVTDRFAPRVLLAKANASGDTEAALPVSEAKIAIDGKTTAYLCTWGSCQAPVHTVDDLAAQLEQA